MVLEEPWAAQSAAQKKTAPSRRALKLSLLSNLYNGRVNCPLRDETAPMIRTLLEERFQEMSARAPAGPAGPAEGV
jgi:hypothetical protein